jgi:transcriptional regulator with XRE-family HTH domain
VSTYNELVGRRLRSIRRQRGFSLQDVQSLSDGEFKAAVLGAYERGERSISVPRLHRLAGYYDVPVAQLLPPDPRQTVGKAPSPDQITIDLTRLDDIGGAESEVLERFLTAIQVERQDFNGRVLTVRRDDLKVLSRLIGTGSEFSTALDEVRAAAEEDLPPVVEA